MNAIASHVLPPHLVSELALHLGNSESTLTVMQAAAEAIRAWIGARLAQPSAPAPSDDAPAQGYQWKTLFLPSGTELRMSTRESTQHASVVGDDIIYRGRPVSPRGMTLAIAGDGRNAWRDVWIRLPGEKSFVPASRCRREAERVAAGLSANPAAELIANMKARLNSNNAPDAGVPADTAQTLPTVPAATGPASLRPAPEAVTMSEVLKTMLELLGRMSERPRPDEERRFNRSRREQDVLADQCGFD